MAEKAEEYNAKQKEFNEELRKRGEKDAGKVAEEIQ